MYTTQPIITLSLPHAPPHLRPARPCRRCHPEDLDASTLPALRECAPAIRDAVRDEGVAEHAAHEVVFVGRPMWELVPPVLDLSSRG